MGRLAAVAPMLAAAPNPIFLAWEIRRTLLSCVEKSALLSDELLSTRMTSAVVSV